MATFKIDTSVAAKITAPAAWPFPTSQPDWGNEWAALSEDLSWLDRALDPEDEENQEINLDGGLSEESEEIETVNATQLARSCGVHFCHAIKPHGSSAALNGVTIAYRRVSSNRNSRMVEVAVSYCSKYDAFNKKIGNSLAAARFLSNNTVVIPVGRGDETIRTLKEIFWCRLVY